MLRSKNLTMPEELKKKSKSFCLSAKLAETPRTSDIAQVRESMKFMAATTLAHTEPLP